MVRNTAVYCAMLAGFAAFLAPAPVTAGSAQQASAIELSDGNRDFDFEIGTWHTRLKRLKGPLSGSTVWVEYEGTSVVRPVMEGRANLVELSVTGPEGKIEGLSLRLYDPQARQWTLNFASIANGQLTPPVIGGFRNGRGEFYAQDSLNGRSIFVRFVIIPVDARTWRFEQAFSADGGKNWEVNWIATDTRVDDNPSKEVKGTER